MAHFAEIDENNTVLRVLVVDDAYQENGQDFLANQLGLGGIWLQTSYNTFGGIHQLGGTPLRKNFAGIGFVYDETRDAFVPPKLFDSWVLNEGTCRWEAPTPMPTDGAYFWNEQTTAWEIAATEL